MSAITSGVIVASSSQGSYLDGFSTVALTASVGNSSAVATRSVTISSGSLSAQIVLSFSQFSTATGAEVLYVYDGATSSSALLAVLSGSLSTIGANAT